MCRKRRSTGQVSWALAIPSILIFLFASVVSWSSSLADLAADLSSQNVFAIWANFYWAILVYPEGPHAYLALVRDPCKTAIQTGQEGAIMLADLLIVSVLLVRALTLPTLIEWQVYRTFVLWGGNYYVIIVPCIAFIATFSEHWYIHMESFDCSSSL